MTPSRDSCMKFKGLSGLHQSKKEHQLPGSYATPASSTSNVKTVQGFRGLHQNHKGSLLTATGSGSAGSTVAIIHGFRGLRKNHEGSVLAARDGRSTSTVANIHRFRGLRKNGRGSIPSALHSGGAAAESQSIEPATQIRNPGGAGGATSTDPLSPYSNTQTGNPGDAGGATSTDPLPPYSNAGLAEARLIDEEEPIFRAVPVNMTSRRFSIRSSRRPSNAVEPKLREQSTNLWGIFVCAVFILATVMGVVFGTRSSSGGVRASTTIANITSDPLALATKLGLPPYTIKTIQEDPGYLAPSAKAYQWLLEDIASAATPHAMPPWKQVQRFSLALFYHALGGDSWKANEGWLDHAADECRDWFFRKVIASAPQMGKAIIFVHESETNQTELIESPCDEEGRFTHLAFAGSNLVGPIPREIALLTSLTYLDVSANAITGSLPTEIAFLTNLERLFANRNFISGSIPTEVGLLTNLEMFDLGNNQNFEGPIPSEFGLLSKKLKVFSTQRSSVTGFVPTELFLLTNLEEYLIHQSLNMTGGTLEGIGKLSNLREFVAHGIPYKSTMPTEVGLLTNLLNFNLWNTQVAGPVPSELWSLTSLRRIDMGDNFLTGPFPSDELGQMSNLQILFINGNRLTGTLPSMPWERMPNVSILSIGGNNGGNQLSGTIPTELGLLTAMTRLDLNMMALTGTIPSELGRMTGMGTLLLHNTELTGTIPPELVAMTTLDAFTVSMTHLTGSIPDELCYGVKEVALKCLSYFGVQGNVCTGFEITDFSCSDSLLCGCSCSNCSSM